MQSQSTPTPESAQPQVEYRDIGGFPGYRVGDDGSVWSCRTGGRGRRTKPPVWRRMSPVRMKIGYLMVNLRADGKYHPRYVHQLILEVFVSPRPEGMQCRHFPDRTPTNNRLTNLSWGTPTENAADKKTHGTVCRGESHPKHKLSAEEVREIRRRPETKGICRALATEFRVSRQSIRGIRAGRCWVHLL